MVNISNYDSSVNDAYAKGQQNAEEVNKTLRGLATGSDFVSTQTQVLDTSAKPPAVVSLVGTNQQSSWATVTPPPGNNSQHSFSSHIAPTLEADRPRIEAMVKQNPTREGATILHMTDEVQLNNKMVDEVTARTNEFRKA